MSAGENKRPIACSPQLVAQQYPYNIRYRTLHGGHVNVAVPPGALEVPIKDTGTSPHTLLDHTKTQLETHPNIALHHQTLLKTHAARAICVEGLRDPYREVLLD